MQDFENSWQDFVKTGDFLSLTRLWEAGIPSARELTLNDGTQVDLLDTGILQFEPKDSSTTYLLISSGVHGNETAPMEIVNQMVKDIFSGQLKVKVNLMLIIGNPPAVNIGKRFQVQNLNRLFSGRYLSSESKDYETSRAESLEKAVINFYPTVNDSKTTRFHFDLHTAIRASKFEKFVLYPYLDERPWDKNHIAFFGGANINTVLLGNQPAGTFSYFTSNRFTAQSATVELGKVRPFGENDMQSFTGIDNNLRCLIEEREPTIMSFSNSDYRVFKIKQEIIKANDNYRLLLDDNVENFTSFNQGTLLASDGENQSYTVENDGEAIVFPNNNVPVGQRVGVLLEEIDL